MLYEKNKKPYLDSELFKNPTSEYRGTPFWAWNCELTKEELERQISILKEMGFGGFHMHSRTGMATEYLSDKFFDFIKFSTEKAKENGMLAWLYDEDRWPSGAAGGLVTKKIKNRAKSLLFTKNARADAVEKEEGIENGLPYLVCAYEVILNKDGTLKKYNKINLDGTKSDNLWYAYVLTNEPTPWFNNQAYVDTLSKEAMDEFIELTYEGYKAAVGSEFSKTVPAIFTDEPQFNMREPFVFSDSAESASIPWTTDFDAMVEKLCGENPIDTLPELFWELEGQKRSSARYNFMNAIAERFATSFMDNCGKWCEENGIYLTGHMMLEPTLELQSWAISDVMRAYRSFTLPGIDVLCERMEFSTAKQAQSAVHQYGREGMLSELYGVTNWDYDFRGHKFQGDWQAALGVTVRVPHLAWLSMRGEAKRDYPASINYQSPWYKEYSYVEDHFARVATAMTRGKPTVKIGVIHPIETFWLYTGPKDKTDVQRRNLDSKFKNVIEWLLFSQLDFDFISESTLPSLCTAPSAPLKVGEMEYDAIVVPACETLRSTTVKILSEFTERGGKVIFIGKAPYMCDGKYSDGALALYSSATSIDFDKVQLLDALSDERIITMINADGTQVDNLIYQLREDADSSWLFIAQAKKKWQYNAVQENVKEQNDVVIKQNVKIRIKGCYEPTVYDTVNGDIRKTPYEVKDGYTELNYGFFANDSLLLRLDSVQNGASYKESSVTKVIEKKVDFKTKVDYEILEDNVFLLDRARFSFDGGEAEDEEEILRIDNRIRERLSWPPRQKKIAQPWAEKEGAAEHFITFDFDIESEIELESVDLGIELSEGTKIVWNEREVKVSPDGYFVDRAISRIHLEKLKMGTNTLSVTLPYFRRGSLEWMYLIGRFGVRLSGAVKTVTPLPEKIGFGSITHQGFPFYSGNITYKLPFTLSEDTRLSLKANIYRGALMKANLDGGEDMPIVYAPYEADFGKVARGEHTVNITLFGNRHNTFAPIHNANTATYYFGPDSFRSPDEFFAYEYFVKDLGILKSPIITYYKEIHK